MERNIDNEYRLQRLLITTICKNQYVNTNKINTIRHEYRKVPRIVFRRFEN